MIPVPSPQPIRNGTKLTPRAVDGMRRDLARVGRDLADASSLRRPVHAGDDRPGFTRILACVIRSTAPGGGDDYTDARYYLDICTPAANLGVGDTFDTATETIPGLKGVITATNLGELPIVGDSSGTGGSHSLMAGQRVLVFGLRTRERVGRAGVWTYVFFWSLGGSIDVLLEKDGGYDGDAATGTEASWTYTATDINTGRVYGTGFSLYGHRPRRQHTEFATRGRLATVTDPSNVGVGAAPKDIQVGGSGSGGSGSGSGSGSTASIPNLYRLMECDEWFPMVPACDSGSGSGSTAGSAGSTS